VLELGVTVRDARTVQSGRLLPSSGATRRGLRVREGAAHASPDRLRRITPLGVDIWVDRYCETYRRATVGIAVQALVEELEPKCGEPAVTKQVAPAGVSLRGFGRPELVPR
jgi:hypothetical protein